MALLAKFSMLLILFRSAVLSTPVPEPWEEGDNMTVSALPNIYLVSLVLHVLHSRSTAFRE